MTTMEEFQQAVALVRACRATVECGCKMDDQEESEGDFLYVACKDYINSYVKRFPVWRGLP